MSGPKVSGMSLNYRNLVDILARVKDDLGTEIANLHVCDASVFPEAFDRPTVMTILASGKRLGAHILETEGAASASA